jgi:hypothetical protein
VTRARSRPNGARSRAARLARDLQLRVGMRRLAFSLAGGLVLASSQVALAHVALRAPIVRDEAMKDGPCGALGSTRGATVCTFRPGQTITIAFDETVEHPGHFRVAFDTDGQDFINPTTPDDTDPTVLINDIADRVTSGEADWGYTQEITFPNVECDNCTLQLIQVMSTAATYDEGDLYFQCADIVLSNAAPETPDPACVAPPPDDGGDPPDDGSGGGDDPPPDDGSGDDGTGGDPSHSGAAGGCALAAGGGRGLSGTVLVLLGALLLQGRRRRR